MGNTSQLKTAIINIAQKYSTIARITTAEPLDGEIIANYTSQIETVPAKYNYLKRTPAKRADIKQWFPKAKSVLICAFNYWNWKTDNARLMLTGSQILKLLNLRGTKPLPEQKKNLNRIYKISRYKAVPHYQKEIKKILKKMLAEFQTLNPAIEGKPFVDTSPVMEKPLAVRSGLGFRGKNSIIINPQAGSFFFIGGLALNIELKPDNSLKYKDCGNCRLCIKSCPTNAISDYKVDIKKCITTWNHDPVENVPPPIAKYRKTMSLACDICQEVCPYNKKTTAPIVPQLKPLTENLF
jgi:epoxyqueuosine reductase